MNFFEKMEDNKPISGRIYECCKFHKPIIVLFNVVISDFPEIEGKIDCEIRFENDNNIKKCLHCKKTFDLLELPNDIIFGVYCKECYFKVY